MQKTIARTSLNEQDVTVRETENQTEAKTARTSYCDNNISNNTNQSGKSNYSVVKVRVAV